MPSAKPLRDYVGVIYSEQDRPFTQYPYKLARYLSLKYKLPKQGKILDLGCGRGEFLDGFIKCGFNGYGVDRCAVEESICPEAKILQSDIENEPLPYNDSFFDVVFSKSVLEHFYYPERLVQEIYRILNPGGWVIIMVPDWESVYKTFYDDYTHRRPFTLTSLKNILVINNFNEVKVEKFRQLPFLWKLPLLMPFCSLVSFAAPRSLRPHSKLVKFSQEVMLLSTALKPDTTLRGRR